MKSAVRWSNTDTPVTSEGSRSGVHCKRRKRAADGLGQAAGERGLADAGHVFEQQVAFAQQGDDGELDGRSLADQHALHVAAQPFGDRLHHGGHRHGRC